MATLTLLEMVQKILNSMDSDDVITITETEEAEQVVDIIEDTYNHLLIEVDPPSLQQTCQLTGLADTLQPTTFTLPAGVIDIGKIKYEITETGDADKSYRDLIYLCPQDFVDKVLIRSSGDANVQEVSSPGGTPLFLFTDQFPRYWTSFDDETIIADAYDSSEESTLVGSKTVLLCKKLPSFTKADGAIPDFPEKAFPLLLAESKRTAHLELKQQDSVINAKRVLQGSHTFKNNKKVTNDKSKKIKFGRK